MNVNVFDPLLLDITFTPLEGRLGGWERFVTTDAAESVAGTFAPCNVPASARAVLLQRADGSWARVVIEDDSYGLARAMLPRD